MLKASNIRIAYKNYNIKGLYVVTEVEYHWSGWVKKNIVNTHLV